MTQEIRRVQREDILHGPATDQWTSAGGKQGHYVPYPYAGSDGSDSNVIDVRAYMTASKASAWESDMEGTDVTSEIQAAVDARDALDIVLGRPGDVFLITDTIAIDKPGWFRGHGNSNTPSQPSATKIIKGNFDGPGILVTPETTGSPTILERFTIDGNGTGNLGDGIVIQGNGCTCREVSAFYMGNDGFRIGDDGGVNANTWYLDRCNATINGRYGLYVSDAATPNANAGQANLFSARVNVSDGIRINSGRANTFVGTHVEENGGYGIYLDALARDNIFFGGDVGEANTTNDIGLASGSRNNMFIGVKVNNSRITDSSNPGQNFFLIRGGDPGNGVYSRGVYHLAFDMNGVNYINASRASGYIAFVTNGDAVNTTNAHFIVTASGALVGRSGGLVGFYGTAPQGKPTVSGSTGGNAALQDLLSELETLGLITDSTT